VALPDWPRAWGEPPVSAQLRTVPADFDVEEEIDFELSGAGEHCWLWVEKENLNTVDAAQRLARFAGLRERDISYAGLKDKQAVTRQWFSLHLLNRDPDWNAWNDSALRILRVIRHHRKLRRGAHRGNFFRLVLRAVSGDIGAFTARLELIAACGVPNYFGEQRFGRDGRNIDAARQWLERGRPRLPRHQMSLYLSSARALLFNQVLAERVRQGNWCTPLSGEVYVLNGSNSTFRQEPDDVLRQRIVAGDVHLSGPLAGKPAGIAAEAVVGELESRCLADTTDLVAMLEQADVDAARRSLRVIPTDWRCEQIEAQDWRLEFRLPKGCFATGLVRELASIGSLPRNPLVQK